MKKKFACNPKIIAGTLDNRYPEIVSLWQRQKRKASLYDEENDVFRPAKRCFTIYTLPRTIHRVPSALVIHPLHPG